MDAPAALRRAASAADAIVTALEIRIGRAGRGMEDDQHAPVGRVRVGRLDVEAAAERRPQPASKVVHRPVDQRHVSHATREFGQLDGRPERRADVDRLEAVSLPRDTDRAISFHPPILLAIVAAVLVALAAAPPAAAAEPAREPAGYEAYHTYAELTAELEDLARAHPDIVSMFSIGKSYEGRLIWAVKISDNVELDEDEPEVLLDGMFHARERISNEMALYAIHLLVDGYTSGNQRIRRIVNSREIFVIPMMNPDGAEYDIAGGKFHDWRKNRQPIPDSHAIGIDLNRGFGYRWGCCGGSSGNPSSITYRGPKPWFAPEVRAYRNFVRSRIIGGRQQIRAGISWHSFGRMVLWPYGYTYTDLPPTMTADDQRTFVALGRQMAELSSYRAMQGSDLYITDGDSTDWLYGTQRVFAYTIELRKGKPLAFYATPSQIAAEAERNRTSLLHFLEQADCPYRAAGLARLNCGPLYEDFEISRGWRVDPFGTDTATAGVWQRGMPRKTQTSAGVKQRKAVPSGQAALVTGLAAGARATSNSVHGGVTSVRSPSVKLAADRRWTLSFRYAFAHNSRAGESDYLRVQVVHGSKRTTVFSQRANRSERNAAWRSATINLDAFAGRTISLLVEASGGGSGVLLEAALDDVRIHRSR